MSEADSSPPTKEGLWNDLPDLVVDKIFSYIALSDRIHASSVCKNWARAFESPNLWKCIDVSLTGENPSQVDADAENEEEESEEEEEDEDEDEEDDSDNEIYEKYRDLLEKNDEDEEPQQKSVAWPRLSFDNEKGLRFAQKYGSYVKSLGLMCDPVSKAASVAFRSKVSEFLQSLIENSCQLHELMVFFNADEWEETAKKELIDAFCEFLSGQHEMESFVLGNYLTGDEVRLLEAVVQASGPTITSFQCMFYNDPSKEGADQKLYYKVLRDLPNLQYVSMSSNSLSDEAITILNNCKNLQTVYLFNLLNRDIPWRLWFCASAQDWRKPLKIHPQIANDDKTDADYWLKCPKVSEVVSFKACVYLYTVVKFRDGGHYIEALRDLQKNYSKNLVSLNLMDNFSFSENEPLENAIQDVLTTCTEIREMRLGLYNAYNLLVQICQMQSLHQIDLQIFEFRCLDNGDVDFDAFMDLILKHNQNLFLDGNWGFEIQSMRISLTDAGRQFCANHEFPVESLLIRKP